MTAPVTGDAEPFAKIPEWLLFHPDLSGDAVRIYGVLARHGKCIKPSRRHISEQAHCSIRTVDKCLAQLVQVGAIRITRRIGEKGDLTSSEYMLRTTAPATPSAESALPPTANDAPPSAENDTTLVQKTTLPLVQILHSKESSSNESNLNEIPPTADSRRAQPWDFVTAFYRSLDKDVSAAPETWRGQQCGIALKLMSDGCTIERAERLARYLVSQTWRESEVTLRTAKGAYGDWLVAKMPEVERSKSPPKSSSNGHAAPDPDDLRTKTRLAAARYAAREQDSA